MRVINVFVVCMIALVAGHGAMVHPRSRNSVDYNEKQHGTTTWAWCQNLTGAECNNGQSAYWYSQGCFIGCKACDHESGRRQTDLCKKGFVGQIPDSAISVNRNATRYMSVQNTVTPCPGVTQPGTQ